MEIEEIKALLGNATHNLDEYMKIIDRLHELTKFLDSEDLTKEEKAPYAFEFILNHQMLDHYKARMFADIAKGKNSILEPNNCVELDTSVTSKVKVDKKGKETIEIKLNKNG